MKPKPPIITEMPRPSKYGNIRIGGHASIKEHTRATQLKLWQRMGRIRELQEQVSYMLIPAQYGEEKTKTAGGRRGRELLERSVKYVADFVYIDNETGKTVVEDAKGMRTKEYILKRKLMLYIHGIRIKEV